ncbi:MAG: glycosyltransferase [Akkermansiaceae bacterium]|nr:glycosyltransferase [Akkermansiaceae bacterium]
MHCLWLTRKYPRPANSGELIYSEGLVSAFAEAGAEVVAVAHDNDEHPVANRPAEEEYVDRDRVRWVLGEPRLGGRLMSLFTRLPSDSYRLMKGGPKDDLERLLADREWDVVVADHAALGWALPQLKAARREGRFSRLVYVSHNHEAKIRREIAANSFSSLPKRIAAQWDAEKYAWQENALCAEADLITAITETELAVYREQFPDREYLCLTPGYRGHRDPDRQITEETPRRVLMCGSFEWIAKRINLERFLENSAKTFADMGVEMQIVGKADESFRREMKERFPAVEFTGRVPDVTPYLKEARFGLIVEEFGGGFKLKALEYVFHRLPLAGLRHAVDGMPLESPDDYLLMNTLPSLAREIAAAIDDVDRLNRMSRVSYEKCATAFEWEDRGRALHDAVSGILQSPPAR